MQINQNCTHFLQLVPVYTITVKHKLVKTLKESLETVPSSYLEIHFSSKYTVNA